MRCTREYRWVRTVRCWPTRKILQKSEIMKLTIAFRREKDRQFALLFLVEWKTEFSHQILEATRVIEKNVSDFAVEGHTIAWSMVVDNRPL